MIEDWGKADIRSWLRQEELDVFLPFADAELGGGRDLLLISHQDLEEYSDRYRHTGLERKRFLAAIAFLRQEAAKNSG